MAEIKFDDVPNPEADLSAQAGPRGYTYQGQPKPKVAFDEPKGVLKDVYDAAGGAAGLGAAGGAVTMSRSPVDEEGGRFPQWLKPLLGAGVGGGAGAIVDRKDILPTAITSMMGEGAGNILGNVGGRILDKARTSFDMSKYIGSIGKRLGEIFGMPIKTRQDIYNALHLGEAEGGAGHAIGQRYKAVQDKIFNAIGGPDVPIAGAEAKRLNEIFYEAVPEFKALVDDIAERAAQPQFTSKYSSFRGGKQTQSQAIKSQVDRLMGEPIAIGDAMEYARLLGGQARKSKAGALGKAVRNENEEVRQALSDFFDKFNTKLPPGETPLGTQYSNMNRSYRQGRTAMRAFDADEIFGKGSGGPKFNKPAWERASNTALEDLKQAGIEDLDAIIRQGRKPGAVSGTIAVGGSGHLPWPLNAMRVHIPRKEITYSPLRPAGDKINPIIDKVFKALGANVGAQVGEGTSEDQTGR